MKLHILYIVCICCFTCRAQIHTFEDYSNCYIGFMKGADTLWPAQFESAIYYVGEQKSEGKWIVQFKGKKGLLNELGTIKIPFICDDLKATNIPGKLMATKNGLKGIISTENKILVPLAYGDVKIITKSLDYHWDEQLVLKKPYFQTTIHNGRFYLQGLLDESGNEVLPNIFRSIDCMSLMLDSLKGNLYFTTEDTLGKSGIYNEQGQLIHKSNSSDIRYLFLSEKKQPPSGEPYAWLIQQKGQYLVNLNSKTKSAVYKEIIPLPNVFLCKSGKGWGVYDADFRLIGTPVNEYLSCIRYSGCDARGYGEGSVYNCLPGQVFVRYDYIKRKSTERYHSKGSFNVLSLVNPKLGVMTDFDYDRVLPKISGRDTVYWCMKEEHEVDSKKNLKLDIYDTELRKRAAFQLFEEAYLWGFNQESRVISFQLTTTGKWGAIDALGNVVIHFENDRYWACDYAYRGESEMNGKWHVFQKDTLKEIYDKNGRLRYKGQFEIMNFNYRTWELKQGTKTIVLDTLFAIISETNESIPAVNVNAEREYSKYLLKDKVLFGFRNNQFEVVPEDFFPKNGQNQCWVHENYFLMDSASRVLDFGAIRKENQMFFVSNCDDVIGRHRIWSETGELMQQLDNVKEMWCIRNLVRINFKNGLSGLWNPQTTQWAIKPNYFFLKSTEKENLFWANDTLTSNYILINEKEEKIFGYGFRETFSLDQEHDFIVGANQKYGIMTPELEFALQPEYDKIEKYANFYFFQKKGKWGIYKNKEQLLPVQFNQVAPDLLPNHIVVFERSNLGILNAKLEWVLPLIHLEDAQRTLDLRTIAGMEFLQSNMGGRFVVQRKEQKNAYRIINNANIISYLRSSAYRETWRKVKDEYPLEIKMNFADSAYCSFLKPNTALYRIEEIQNAFFNYRITGDSIRSFTLKEIIKQDSVSQEAFKKMLTHEVNLRQFFGPVCVNLDQQLAQMINLFQFDAKGIRFYKEANQFKHILLTWEQIRPILQNPEWFKFD